MHELIPPSVNFAALLLILIYFCRKPVIDMVAARRQNIQTQVEEARTQKAEAERRYKEFSDKLRSFESEAKDILERARLDGEATKAKIIREAQAMADRIVKDADATAQSNVQEFKDQIRRDTIAQAVALAERVIREKLSNEEHRRIVNDYVGKV